MRLETWRENKENKNCRYIAEYLPTCGDCIKTEKDMTRAVSVRGICWSTSGAVPVIADYPRLVLLPSLGSGHSKRGCFCSVEWEGDKNQRLGEIL